MHEENGHKETRKPTLKELHDAIYKRKGHGVSEEDFDDDDVDCFID